MTVRGEGPEGRRTRPSSPRRPGAGGKPGGTRRLWLAALAIVGLLMAISVTFPRSEPNDLSAVIPDVDYATEEQFPDGSYEGVAVHVPDIYAAREDTLRVRAEVRDARVVRIQGEAGSVPLPSLEPARLDTDGLATFDVPPRGMMNVLLGPAPSISRH